VKELITDNPSCSIADYLAMGDIAVNCMAEETKHSGLVASDIERVFYDEDTGLIIHVCEYYLDKHKPHAQTRFDGVITNPVQRYYFNLTEYECRPQEEINDWFGIHYVAVNFGTKCYEVLCLDGRNHDRASVIASYPSAFDAIGYAENIDGDGYVS
jgi:hypothetical protein